MGFNSAFKGLKALFPSVCRRCWKVLRKIWCWTILPEIDGPHNYLLQWSKSQILLHVMACGREVQFRV